MASAPAPLPDSGQKTPRHSLRERVSAAEQAIGELKKKRKDGWDKFSALAPLLNAFVVALLGYYLNTTINRALHEQQIQTANVKEMRDLLRDLGRQDVGAEDANATALALSAFGRHAIGPLVAILDEGQEVRGTAAEKGLRAVALGYPQEACPRLVAVAADTRGLYRWETHRFAISVVGDVGCPGASAPLRGFKDALSGDGLKRAVREGSSLDDQALARARQEMEKALGATFTSLGVGHS